MQEQNFKDTRDVNGEYEGKVSKADVKKAYNAAYPQKKDVYQSKRNKVQKEEKEDYNKPSCFVVDGYNLLHSIDEFNEIAKSDLTTARQKVIDLLCDYKAIMGGRLIAVFDAYKQPEGQQDYIYDGINIVYTKANQLADTYIEQLVPELIKDYKVTVITSDALEQYLVFAHGALRMSCDSFISIANEKLERDYHRYIEKNKEFKNKPLEGLRDKLEEEENENI